MKTVKPFRHVLTFSFRGTTWKAIWFADKQAAMLRQHHQGDFEIAWSVARDHVDEETKRIFREAGRIMRYWQWPRRMDLTSTGEPHE